MLIAEDYERITRGIHNTLGKFYWRESLEHMAYHDVEEVAGHAALVVDNPKWDDDLIEGIEYYFPFDDTNDGDVYPMAVQIAKYRKGEAEHEMLRRVSQRDGMLGDKPYYCTNCGDSKAETTFYKWPETTVHYLCWDCANKWRIKEKYRD